MIDGHGGQAAADYVAENLGNNILREVGTLGKERGSLEEAIRKGYLVTDKEFLSQVSRLLSGNNIRNSDESHVTCMCFGEFQMGTK